MRGSDERVYLFDHPARVDHSVVSFRGNLDHDPAKVKLFNDQREIHVHGFPVPHGYTSQNFIDDADVDPACADDAILHGNWVAL